MMNPTVVEVVQIVYADYETIFESILFDGNPNPEFFEAMMLDDLPEIAAEGKRANGNNQTNN